MLPALAKCQLHSKNGVIPQGNGLPGKYVSFQDELPPETSIGYYGNITGWHRYEVPTQEADRFSYPSTSGYTISR